MDFMVILGWIIGCGAIGSVLLEGGIWQFFINKHALILVFGGTLGATCITFPWSLLRRLPKSIIMFLFPGRRESPDSMMALMLSVASRARRTSMESVEADMRGAKDQFLANGLKMVADGLPPKTVRENLEKEIYFTGKRHAEVQNVFKNMAAYAPIFGLLGTLVGVVEVLLNLSDPKSMGMHMAVAMTATFYGIFGANFMFLPVAGKLQTFSEEELFLKEVMIEGILSIQRQEIPAILSRRLEAYLNRKNRGKLPKGGVADAPTERAA
jgi:chemotaxis protein MotA